MEKLDIIERKDALKKQAVCKGFKITEIHFTSDGYNK